MELLPTLHEAGRAAVDGLHAVVEAASRDGTTLQSDRLPACSVVQGDITLHDCSDADVCYLCSTAFTAELLASWTSHAASLLRTGCRVITLSLPLLHPSFELEHTFGCELSWGCERAFVHRKLSPAWVGGAGRLVAKGVAADRQRTQWSFARV